MDNETKIRYLALKLAVESSSVPANPSDIIRNASRYLAFMRGSALSNPFNLFA